MRSSAILTIVALASTAFGQARLDRRQIDLDSATSAVVSVEGEATSAAASLATGVATTILSVENGVTQTVVSVYGE
ncbi:hypothetical protein JCM8097_001646, partial [Rhodosporidiobolus ruineniae]